MGADAEGPPLRALIRSAAEQIGTRSGLAALARRTLGDRVAILAYHDVVPAADAGRGDASLHLPLPAFLDQVERLRRTHRIVDLETAARDPAAGSSRPRAVITFDDAYRGAVTLALPELVRRGIPATVFVSPGLLGASSTWWDELAEADGLTEEIRRRALEECGGRPPEVRGRFLPGAAAPRLPAAYGIATREELRRHCGRGITLGSHAWEHEHLPSLDSREIEDILRRARDWLADFGAPEAPWLALPYGAGSEALGRMAVGMGHGGVLRIGGGLWRRREGPAWVPRLNIPAGLSLRGLELRVSGLRTR